MGPAEFLLQYWEWIMLILFVANKVFQKIPWKPGKDFIDLIWDLIKFITAPPKGPGKLPMLFIGLFLLIPSLVFAAPYLICDPQTNVTRYVITIDGDTTEVLAFDLGDGTVMLRYDLAGISAGTHNTTVKAKNIWGESVAVPFDFVKALPAVPEAIRIE